MTHLTAINAATHHGQLPAAYPTRRNHRVPVTSPRPAPHCAESIFYSPVANFLEMHDAVSHYSVIGRQVIGALAPGFADRHLLNDQIEAPSWGDSAGARAQAGEE
jgi:hypothetical protein